MRVRISSARSSARSTSSISRISYSFKTAPPLPNRFFPWTEATGFRGRRFGVDGATNLARRRGSVASPRGRSGSFMKRWFAAAVGLFGLVAYVRRRRRPAELEAEPADELRAKLAETRAAPA